MNSIKQRNLYFILGYWLEPSEKLSITQSITQGVTLLLRFEGITYF